MSGQGDDYSGWGGSTDTLVVASGGSGNSGNGMMVALLVVALLASLGLSGYSMWRLKSDNGVRAGETLATKKKQDGEVKALEDKIAQAMVSRRDDLDYITALEADNAALAKMPNPRQAAAPPRPPERQLYLDALQAENLQRRATPNRPVTSAPRPPGYDAFKSDPLLTSRGQ